MLCYKFFIFNPITEKTEMKKTLTHLPGRKRDELQLIVEKILERLPQAQLIILYGSYARGDYTEYDDKIEFGVRTIYMSDYDILVVTDGITDFEAGRKLANVENWYSHHYPLKTPVQFVNDDIAKVNKDISDGRFFYTDIKREGVLLYNSGNFKLERRRKQRFNEIKIQAEEYYKENYESAEEFYKLANYSCSEGLYKKGSFLLHQTCENLFKAIRLTYTLYSGKQHNLERLLDAVKGYSLEGFSKIFPRQTAEDERLFQLVKAAYVEARYNPEFVVTKADIDALTPSVELFFDLTKQLCEQRIREYEAKM